MDGVIVDNRIVDIVGWMHETELQWLNDTACKVPEGGLIVEIGAWMGRSSAAIYTGANGKNPVISVDTWQGSPDEPDHDIAKTVDILEVFKANMCGLGLTLKPFTNYHELENQCYYLVGDSMGVYELFPDESITWLFYDGRHTLTGENIDAWLPKMRLDGLLTGHDYFCFYDYIQQELHKRFYIHGIVYSIWIRYMGLKTPEWL